MQFVNKEEKVLNYAILILVAYFQEQEEMRYFVEYFTEHTEVTPYHYYRTGIYAILIYNRSSRQSVLSRVAYYK